MKLYAGKTFGNDSQESSLRESCILVVWGSIFFSFCEGIIVVPIVFPICVFPHRRVEFEKLLRRFEDTWVVSNSDKDWFFFFYSENDQTISCCERFS